MKKAIKILIMTTVLILMFGAVNAFAADDIGVYVDGKAIEFDVAPQIINDRTMIPFRYVANAFDAEVDYKEEADGRKIVTAVQGNKALILTIGNTDAVLVEKGVETVISFDVAPVIVDSRTLVPVRLIGEAFGCSVGWDNINRDVIIIDIESGVTADYKAQCPELFDEVLSADLTKIQGYYHVNMASLLNGVEEAITMDIAADDDAVMISIPNGNEQVDVIATADALYVSSSSSLGLWAKYSYEDIAPDFKFDPTVLVMDSDMLLKALADYLMTYDASNAFEIYNTLLCSTVEDAKEGALKIETEGNLKAVSYAVEESDNNMLASFEFSKGYENNTLSIAQYYAVIVDSTTEETVMGATITIEREDAAEAFDIKAPSDDVVVSMEELMAMQSNQ